MTQKDLEELSSEAAIKFKQLYDLGVADIEFKRYNFWLGWNSCDREAGHFSQDEITWFTDCFLGIEDLGEDSEAFKGILKEMRKGQRG